MCKRIVYESAEQK